MRGRVGQLGHGPEGEGLALGRLRPLSLSDVEERAEDRGPAFPCHDRDQDLDPDRRAVLASAPRLVAARGWLAAEARRAIALDARVLLGREEDQVVLPDQLRRALVAEGPDHGLVGEPDDAVLVDVHALDRPVHDRAIPLLGNPERQEGSLRVGARRLLAGEEPGVRDGDGGVVGESHQGRLVVVAERARRPVLRVQESLDAVADPDRNGHGGDGRVLGRPLQVLLGDARIFRVVAGPERASRQEHLTADPLSRLDAAIPIGVGARARPVADDHGVGGGVADGDHRPVAAAELPRRFGHALEDRVEVESGVDGLRQLGEEFGLPELVLRLAVEVGVLEGEPHLGRHALHQAKLRGREAALGGPPDQEEPANDLAADRGRREEERSRPAVGQEFLIEPLVALIGGGPHWLSGVQRLSKDLEPRDRKGGLEQGRQEVRRDVVPGEGYQEFFRGVEEVRARHVGAKPPCDGRGDQAHGLLHRERGRERPRHLQECLGLSQTRRGLREHPCVVQRQRRLVGEGGEEPELGLGHPSSGDVAEAQGADRFAPDHQGHADHRPLSRRFGALTHPIGHDDAGIREKIGRPHGPPLDHRATDDPLAGREDLPDPPSRVHPPRDGQAPERPRIPVSLVEGGGPAVTEPPHRVDDEVVHPVQVEGSDQLTSHLGEGVRGLFSPPAR